LRPSHRALPTTSSGPSPTPSSQSPDHSFRLDPPRHALGLRARPALPLPGHPTSVHLTTTTHLASAPVPHSLSPVTPRTSSTPASHSTSAPGPHSLFPVTHPCRALSLRARPPLPLVFLPRLCTPHGACDLALCVSLRNCFSFVVLALASCQADLDLCVVPHEVHTQWDQRVALLAHLAD
jgi:hypothetical protein